MLMDKIIQVTVITLLLVGAAHAEVYKWTDDRGKVHYSDQPVENSQQLQVNESRSPAPAVSSEQREERRRKLLQALEEDRANREQQKEKQKQVAARRQRQCVLAKDRLKNYEGANTLYDLDSKGNRVTLSDAQRKKAIDQLRSQIEQNCN